MLLAGRYELLDEIGLGGTSTVYRAWDRVLQAHRAVKLLRTQGRNREKRRRRFEAEARVMARVRHPNVLPIHDLGVSDGDPFLVTDIAEGGNLADRLIELGPLPVRSMVEAAIAVLSALEVAHGHGVVHRDIKPANLLLDRSGRVLVGDFGIALLSDDEDRHTRAGAALGTFSYMAPEQRIDASSVTPSADLYAVAATLYELVSAESPVDLFAAGRGSPRWWGIPEVLRAILQRALRPDPAERFPSAREMRQALEAVLPFCADEPAPLPVGEREEPVAVEGSPAHALGAWYRRSVRDKATLLRDSLRALQRGEEGAGFELRRIAHTLRGSGASFGYPAVTTAAAAAEDAEDAEDAELPNRIAELVYVLRDISEDRRPAVRAQVIAAVRDPELRALLEVTLVRPSWDVEIVGDLAAASRLTDTERFGAILLEDGMGGFSGAALLQRFGTEADPARTIVMGRDDDALRRVYLALGVWRFVEKPIDPVRIAALVERLLSNGARSPTLDGLSGVVDRQTFRLALVHHRQEHRDGRWSLAALQVPPGADAEPKELARRMAAEVAGEHLVARWDDRTYLVLLPDAADEDAATAQLGALQRALAGVSTTASAAAVVAGHTGTGPLLVRVVELVEAQAPGGVRVERSAPLDQGRVLVIDDDDGVAEIVRRILEGDGYEVQRQATGTGAVAAARACTPDLILLDVELPGQDGFEVLQALQADRALQGVPVIMLTARARDSHVVLALELGAEDYVVKPFDAGVLQARVRRCMRRRRP